MGRVERERFVPDHAKALAYFDRPLKLSADRSMMPPAALGKLLSEAKPRPGQRALVIGSATGYSAAILREIGLHVVALESDLALAKAAGGVGIETTIGELAKGAPKEGPYDIILLDGAVEEIPAALGKQLAPDGQLVGAIIDRGVTRLIVGTCASGVIGWRTVADSDVDALPGFERPRAFTF
jgi:protein-L-isoaspartate(D-aspartate) O-methyltransferase